MSTPNVAIPTVPEGTLDPAAGLNAALDVIDVLLALLQRGVISMTLTAPPISPADGDMYVVAAPATGAWAAHETAVARYVEDGAFWTFYAPATRIAFLLNQADGQLYQYTGDSPVDWEPWPRRSALVNAVDDTAAATAGVGLGEMYRNGSALMIRVA